MKLEILNGHLVDPANEIDQPKDVFMTDGKVVAVDKPPDGWKADHTINAANKLVLPGLVELSASLRQPGQEHKATIQSETKAAAAAGITSLACLPTTNPVVDSPAEVELIERLSQDSGHCRVYVIGALTKGLKGENLSEMAALKAAGCVGVTNVLHPLKSSLVLRRAMEYASSQALTVFTHPLDHHLANNGCVHEGLTSLRLGLPGIPGAAETAALAFHLALIEELNVRTHFCRLSTLRSVNMIARARENHLPVTADVSILHLYLTDSDIQDFDGLCHNLPPYRTQPDRDGLRMGLQDGTLTAICADHQPHEIEATLAPFQSTEPGSSNLESLLPLVLQLVQEGVLSLKEAVRCVTQQPAEILGISAGNLSVGGTADACIVDPGLDWVLTSETLLSRGKNTPMLGRQCKGRTTHTILGGKPVYQLENG
ncbi:MAG: dihydroorotase [Gammaproteobacteria bacterium]|nr:dihydroorotase [Gammaproteobacteria bacterium]